jgi:hypothetical protein
MDCTQYGGCESRMGLASAMFPTRFQPCASICCTVVSNKPWVRAWTVL